MEENRLEHNEHISKMVKTIHFPAATKFADLFDDWKVSDDHNATAFPKILVKPDVVEYWGGPLKGGHISDFCSTHRTDIEGFLRVLPNKAVTEFILENTIWPDYDSIYFELTQRDDGVLVASKNNAILASRWLALLPLGVLGEIMEKADVVHA
jgi:hypothetical protein